VEDQLDLQCLRHSFNNLLAGTDRCSDEALDQFMGLTQEAAELLTPNRQTGMWTLEDLQTLLLALMPVELFRADIQYFYAYYGAPEFALQLGRSETLGAIVHLRCLDGKRVDHYVAIVPRLHGSVFRYSIVDSMTSDTQRQLVSGHFIGLIANPVNVNEPNGFLVATLLGRFVRRRFHTCHLGMPALRLQKLPAELAAADVPPALAADRRVIYGVAFICRPETLSTAEPQQPHEAGARQAVVEPTCETVLQASTQLPPSDEAHPSRTVQTRIVKAATKLGEDWVVDAVPDDSDEKKDGIPTCHGNNSAPWIMPTRLTFPWMEDGTRRYVDQASGLTRNLQWADVAADRARELSVPGAKKPLRRKFAPNIHREHIQRAQRSGGAHDKGARRKKGQGGQLPCVTRRACLQKPQKGMWFLRSHQIDLWGPTDRGLVHLQPTHCWRQSFPACLEVEPHAPLQMCPGAGDGGARPLRFGQDCDAEVHTGPGPRAGVRRAGGHKSAP
jgi:hypothetical protein